MLLEVRHLVKHVLAWSDMLGQTSVLPHARSVYFSRVSRLCRHLHVSIDFYWSDTQGKALAWLVVVALSLAALDHCVVLVQGYERASCSLALGVGMVPCPCAAMQFLITFATARALWQGLIGVGLRSSKRLQRLVTAQTRRLVLLGVGVCLLLWAQTHMPMGNGRGLARFRMLLQT